jgi:hypothetical protein
VTPVAVHGDGERTDRLARALDAAHATLRRNVVPGRGPHEPTRYLRAGGGYDDPWTRDAAINAWQGGSWLLPDVAGETLVMVCRDDGGVTRVVDDDQWWDRLLWVVGARHHALLTGDRDWLEWAYAAGAATAEVLHTRHHDRCRGLYRGPAVMQDGISGYPAELHERARAGESFVLDHAGSDRWMCLSTNIVHVMAQRALAAMARDLGRDGRGHALRAAGTAAAVDRCLARGDSPLYSYVLDCGDDSGQRVRRFDHQEALGHALAVLAGLPDPARARRIAAALHREPMGVVNVWPRPEPLAASFTRHGDACWPMVMGLWAQAVAATGDAAAFGEDLGRLVDLALGCADGEAMAELHDPRTGAADGGLQAGRRWRSEPDQTWTATAVIGVVLHALAGLAPRPGGLRVRPVLPPGLGPVTVEGVPYRAAVVDLHLSGAGAAVVALRVDEVPTDPGAQVHVPATATGRVTVRATLAPSPGGPA